KDVANEIANSVRQRVEKDAGWGQMQLANISFRGPQPPLFISIGRLKTTKEVSEQLPGQSYGTSQNSSTRIRENWTSINGKPEKMEITGTQAPVILLFDKFDDSRAGKLKGWFHRFGGALGHVGSSPGRLPKELHTEGVASLLFPYFSVALTN